MYTGTLINDLMAAVEWAEQKSHVQRNEYEAQEYLTAVVAGQARLADAGLQGVA